MRNKPILKGIFLLTLIMFMCAGIYTIVKRIGSMDIFTVKSVEIRGVVNSDRKKLDQLGQKLIGLNIFNADVEQFLYTQDPWVQKITASRVLPDGINIKVYEEKSLFAFRDKTNQCYVFTMSKKQINTNCENVKIFAEKKMTDEQALAFADLLNENPFLKNTDIVLMDYSFTVKIGNDLIYCPYDKKIFNENFTIFVSSIKKLYTKIEYVDITIDKRIFVKGARNESNSKG